MAARTNTRHSACQNPAAPLCSARWLLSCALICLGLGSSTALALQEQSNVQAQIQLGRRAELPRAGLATIPVLVIVDSPEAYAHAVGRWTAESRFPVLIDDGSAWSMHAIGRFAHAFDAERIVRWTPAEPPTLPEAPEARAAELARLQAAAWEAPEENPDLLVQTWASRTWIPPGVVVTDAADPAWTGALALAVGRGLPMIFVDSLDRPIDHETTREHAAMLSKAVSDWSIQANLTWDRLGDGIDAITLCLNDPARVRLGEDDTRALTDLVGRHEDDRRWAWASQVFGTPAQSAYMAMCSLFIQPRTAWIFDAYESSEPWGQWDGTAAAELLRTAQVNEQPLFTDVRLSDEPQQSLTAWRIAGSRGIGGDSGAMVLVNTSGNSDFFDLEPGRARPGDLPHMLSPSVVHFVHSWSALFPGKRETIAGRWLERGAFAYVGAIQEPGLQAFVPTPIFAGRMLVTSPWAASARTTSTEPWRVAVFGDALFCIGPPTRRIAADDLPLDSVVDLGQQMRESARAGDWVQLFRALAFMGDHQRTAQIASAMLRDRPEAITPSIARSALFAVAVQGNPEDVFELYRRLPQEDARSGWARDLLWNAAQMRVPEGGLNLLLGNLRADQEEADRARINQATGQ